MTWRLFRTLHGGADSPWLIGRDLNEILSDDEKAGGVPRGSHSIENFREALDDCNLKDTNYRGLKFTWNNRRFKDCIWERLDRFLCNTALENILGHFEVLHLDWSHSDHRPIEFSTDLTLFPRRKMNGSFFKFEEC